MIPRNYITEWKGNAQWPDDTQVEHDLIIERALVAFYQDEFLAISLRSGVEQLCINYGFIHLIN